MAKRKGKDLLARMFEDSEPETEEGKPSASCSTLGTELAALKDEIKESEDIVKDLKARRDLIRVTLLPDAMEKAGLIGPNGKGGFTMAEGGRVHLRSEVYVSCPQKHRVAFHAWLEENGHGDLIVPTVHSQTLKAFIKEQRRNGVDVPEELLTIHDETMAVAVKS